MRRYAKQRIFSYPDGGKAALISPAAGKQLRLYGVYPVNRSGGNQDLGVLKKFRDAAWLIGTTDGAAYTDQTSAVQGGASTPIVSLVNGEGFIVQAQKPFHLIGLSVSVAATGSPVYAYEYFNGTSWATVPMLATPSLASTGDKLLLFAPPSDWAPGGTETGLNASYYAIRVRATTAPTTAIEADDVWVGELLAFQGDVPHNGVLGYVPPADFSELLENFEELMPYFSVPAAGNLVTVRYYQEG